MLWRAVVAPNDDQPGSIPWMACQVKESKLKTCKRCNTEKARSEFHRHSNRLDGLQTYCKSCKSGISSDLIKRNPELLTVQAERNKVNRAANRKYVSDYKESHGCLKCGEKHPACLDLHHTDQSIKDSSVSQMLYNCKDKIDVEIAKCVVLCSNCHRKHHADVPGYEI